jgi:hypothetical protein
MDNLHEIIGTLNKTEVKEFRVFINRLKNKKNRKDLELFNLIVKSKNEPKNRIFEKIYPDNNQRAYHALRIKLMRHLMDFLYLKRINSDTTSASQVLGLQSLAIHLFDHRCTKTAWKYMAKAEKIAIETEQYDILNNIYNIAIKHSPGEYAPALKDTLRKRKSNKELANESERISIAQSIIKEKLVEVRVSGKDLQFDTIISQVLDKYSLTDVIQKRASLLFQIMTIFRSAIIAKKEYYLFETFLIGHFKRFVHISGFRKNDAYYKICIIYMIAHTLYRNKKFTESQSYLQEMKDEIKNVNKVLSNQFYVNYAILYAANSLFQGNLQLATTTITKLLSTLDEASQTESILNARLNLVTYYFYNNQFSEANKEILNLSHSNAWYEKRIGVEWVLKKELITALIQFEMGNDDISLNKIRSIERSLKIIKTTKYHRVKTYLSLIKEIIEEPHIATSVKFLDRVESAFNWIPMEQEDLQAVIFYAWLKSKMINKSHYNTLLELTAI